MISAARCSTDSLPALAGFRADAAVRIHVEGGWCWARWPEGRDDVLATIRPIPGVEFYEFRTPHWYRAGSRLPSSRRPPEGNGESIARLLFPGTFPIPPVEEADVPKLPLQLERGGPAQPATALACDLAALIAWGDTATTAELRATRAAVSGSQALVLSAKLPAVAAAERFWGSEIFVPVGFRIAPALPLHLLRQAVGATADEYAFFREAGIDLVPRSTFEPLTRAGLRMAVRA